MLLGVGRGGTTPEYSPHAGSLATLLPAKSGGAAAFVVEDFVLDPAAGRDATRNLLLSGWATKDNNNSKKTFASNDDSTAMEVGSLITADTYTTRPLSRPTSQKYIYNNLLL